MPDPIMLIIESIQRLWPGIVATAHILVAVTATLHAINHKREPQATVGWVGLIWLSPFLGAFIYWLFGINRIHHKARTLRSPEGADDPHSDVAPTLQSARHQTEASSMPPGTKLKQFGDRIFQNDLESGNALSILDCGEQAYEQMLKAIHEAEKSVFLMTYIFDNDRAGQQFVEALSNAHHRGVEVRVLVDGAGANYSFPTIVRRLRKSGVRTARFLPTSIPWHMSYINLRNHRKVMVVDGKFGFTGGMNIRESYLPDDDMKVGVQDLHFKLEGPIVHQLLSTAASDWQLATGEILLGDKWWLSTHQRPGHITMRGIADGPDHHFEHILWMILGAMSHAKKSIRIVTPYFLPETAATRLLSIAALSGVEVQIILPEVNNLRFVQWASIPTLPYLIRRGCQIYYSPPPFDHSKLMIVDDYWTLIGSSNWDPRSFRLNFEFNVECYSEELAGKLTTIFERKRMASRRISATEIDRQPYWRKIRNGLARLFTPYL